MNKYTVALLFLLIFDYGNAQLAEVQATYNNVGDIDFVAYNNTNVPLFLNIDFADLENTTFNEPLPYIKMLEPGFNTLFTLQRDVNAEPPRFNYKIKSFKSNPWAKVNLDFPYLFPFSPGTKVLAFDVKNVDGFMGFETKGWLATGFQVQPGQEIFASRNGIVVDIAAAVRTGDPESWYTKWTNSITLLQPDGTLICYRNVVDRSKVLKTGTKIYAGQKIGEIAPGANELVMLIYHQSVNSNDLIFIIPKFVTANNQHEMIITSKEYIAVHPYEICGLEMNNKEKRKFLK